MRSRRAEAVWIESRSRWQINVQRDGERKTFTSSTAGRLGKHEAEQKADHWLEKFSTDQRLGNAWELFIADKRNEVTTRTVNNLDQVWKHITKRISENKRLSMITVYDWQCILNGMKQEDYSSNTINMVKATITSFSRYAINRRWDCEEIKEGMLVIPRGSRPAKEKEALSDASFKALFELDDIDNRFIYLYQLLALTGLRISEAIPLEWDDISDGMIHLQRSVGLNNEIRHGKTKNAMRNVPIIPQAQSVLDEQRSFLFRFKLADTKLVFPDINSGLMATYATVSRQWEKVQEQIGTSCSIHELRHTYISIVKSTVPMPLLKQVVGHSDSMNTLGVYGHEVKGDAELSARYIQQAFDKRVPKCVQETCTE